MPCAPKPCGPLFSPLPAVRRTVAVLCAGLMWLALSAGPLEAFSPVSQALAQSQDFATRALFMAVDKDDLPGVRAAIEGGADVEARGFNGMQAVDLAIEQGHFDIAHYLISVRNQRASGTDTPVQPTPSPQQLAEAAKLAKPPQKAPGLALPKGAPDPFSTPRTGDGLPVIGDIKEPAVPAAPAAPTPPVRPTATKKFVSTFLDFFKPANTTGITRKVRVQTPQPAKALSEAELAQQLRELEAEQGAITIPPKAPAPAAPPQPRLSPETATPEAKPEAVARADAAAAPIAPADDPFADVQFGDAASTADEQLLGGDSALPPLDPSKPFGGRVDPDILALLSDAPAADTAAADDPFASVAEADPFAMPEDTQPIADGEGDPFAMLEDAPKDSGSESVAGLLDGLDSPQEVSVLESKSPPSQDAIDPFATLAEDGSVDEMAGLLESTGEDIDSGWGVKEVEGANIPNEIQLLSTIEPTGDILEGIELALGADTVIGQEVGEERLQMLKEETIHQPCLSKGGPETLYCVDKVSWPFEMEDDFLVDTIMYQGTRTIARYDAGRATNFHALFNAPSFARVVKYYSDRYGQPTQVVQRAIAPLGQPRSDNPTYIWQSREAGTDTTTTLEIRKFDDARGSFPDTKRGALLLYRSHSGSIFPQLSQLELMVLKDSPQTADTAPATPDTVW